MEVHHHSASPKKWTHYLWEFLMLFLAVFCGFLAENQREHIAEHQRERKYVESLLEDLKEDTSEMNHDIPFWETYIKRIDTLQMEIREPPSKRNTVLLYQCVANMRRYENFQYHDRTIEQLKNAGNFRLIRNKMIADSLIEYDAYIKSELRDMEIQSNSIWQSLNFLQDRFFNSDFYQFRKQYDKLDSAVQANPEILAIRKGKDEELFEYYNRLEYFKTMTIYRNSTNKHLLMRANNLIAMIKTGYHVE